MRILKRLKRALLLPVVGIIFAVSAISTPVYAAEPAAAAPVLTAIAQTSTSLPTTVDLQETTQTAENEADPDSAEEDKEEDSEVSEQSSTTCYSQIGALGWLVCPATGVLAKAIDSIYSLIEELLVIQPISMEDGSPVFVVWTYMRNIANIIFVIMLLVVIYSQLTGFGISNYGVKKMLPNLIVSAILINLSFIICTIAVDLSNIIGAGIRTFLTQVGEDAMASGIVNAGVLNFSIYDLFVAIAGGGTIAALAISVSGGALNLLLLLIPVIVGAVISVLIGLFTIALRQAVVSLLVMISPIAFICYFLPNTKKWYNQWLNIFSQMIFFYPMFSLLFGASRLAGWVLISSAASAFGVILGVAVQILPLFLSVSLMKMSNTILGGISNRLNGIGVKASSGAKNALNPYRELNRQRQLQKGLTRRFNPFSAASWRAFSAKNQHKLADSAKLVSEGNQALLSEHAAALKRGTRIIGYDKDKQPIYTQLPVRENKYMRDEMTNRELKLRAQTADLEKENALGNAHDYLAEHGVTNGQARKTANRMGGHYLDYRAQLEAKANNDIADERFWNRTVMEAAKKDDLGNPLDANAYNKYVRTSAGSDAYAINRISHEGESQARATEMAVIGGAYGRDTAQRASNIKKFESYMDRQVTKEVERQYKDFIQYDNVDGMVASHNILAKRGDYDKIAKNMTDYLNSGHVRLGEDTSNVLAMSFLGMKDSAPALARLGKYMNMETWAFTSGSRTTQDIRMDDFVTGEVVRIDANGNKVYDLAKNDDGTIKLDANGDPVHYRSKINLASSLEGTRLTGIDRTAYAAQDAIMKSYAVRIAATPEIKRRAAAGDAHAIEQLARLEDIQESLDKTMMPQVISALPTFASGSEQIHAMVGHLTGTKFKNGKYENDIDNDDEISHAVARKSMDDYLGSLTSRDLLSMKTDTWNGFVTRLSLDYKKQHDGATDDEARDAAHEYLRNKLSTQIKEIGAGNWNLDMMKTKIKNALKIPDVKAMLDTKNKKKGKNDPTNLAIDARVDALLGTNTYVDQTRSAAEIQHEADRVPRRKRLGL